MLEGIIFLFLIHFKLTEIRVEYVKMVELFPPYGATMFWCRYIFNYSQKWMASQRNAVLFFVHYRAKQKARHDIEHISDADKTLSPSLRQQTRAEEIITTEFISRVLSQVCCQSHVTNNYKHITSAVHLSRKCIYIRIRTTTTLRNF